MLSVPSTFAALPVGATFYYHAAVWRKRSTRTATLMLNPDAWCHFRNADKVQAVLT